ncbi:MAG: MarR family transcriptional regulator [Vagococcus sp.]|uniref:MarR family winged helix-turn-helix transcriptional regulator n=1 Tax=Vagococcus sp. TaxID=1933889 RepID=UPI002FCC2C71
MYENNILKLIAEIAHHPFLIFADRVEEKTDNAVETLKLLSIEGDTTAGRISEYLDIKPSSVTQIIKKLEKSETVERIKSSEDARVTLVRLTDKGRENLAHREGTGASLRKEMFKGFSQEELQEFSDYLTRLEETILDDEFSKKLNQVFSDDKRWQQFDEMSAHFSRSREQMMERGRFNDPREYGGFNGHERFRGRRNR